MINNKYYDGFAGETEMLIYSKEENEETDGFRIWIGYFEYMLEAIILEKVKTGGILESYINQDGWYDESQWKVQDLQQAIFELEKFSIEKVESRENSIIEILPKLQSDLLKFLKKALLSRYFVYIQCE
jgi:hypothetical protein